MPAERIVRHVLSVTQGGDWPIQRDALEAVLRRCASTHTDEIQIVGHPRSRLLGLYTIRRRGSRACPYRTLLRRIDPRDSSCDCADFLRNSLGLFKHLVAVLEDQVSKQCRVDLEREVAPAAAPLRWDPIRPLTGLGDWLARVRWVDGAPDRTLRRWLRSTNGRGRTAAIAERLPEGLTFVDRCLACSATATASRHCTRCYSKSARGRRRASAAHETESSPLVCAVHEETHPCSDAMFLPVVNSSRMGVCDYAG